MSGKFTVGRLCTDIMVEPMEFYPEYGCNLMNFIVVF